MSDQLYQFLAPNKEQCILVEKVKGDDALGFVVGDTRVRKDVFVPQHEVAELYDALGKWLGLIPGPSVIVDGIRGYGAAEQAKIFTEVHLERRAQDAQWGGPAHDDEEHDAADWSRFMQQQAGKGFAEAHRQLGPEWRARFVKIAALAVAAIESIDRQAKVV